MTLPLVGPLLDNTNSYSYSYTHAWLIINNLNHVRTSWYYWSYSPLNQQLKKNINWSQKREHLLKSVESHLSVFILCRHTYSVFYNNVMQMNNEHASEQVRTGNHLPWWTLSSFMASGLLKIKTGDHLPWWTISSYNMTSGLLKLKYRSEW